MYETLALSVSKLSDGWRETNLMLAPHMPVLIAVAMIIALIILAHWALNSKKTSRGPRKMSTREREKYVKSLLGDIITDGLEDAEFQGKLTRDEVNTWYRRLGNLVDLRDLLPKSQETIKEGLKKRVGNGLHKPVPLPDLQEDKPRKRKLFANVS